VLEAQYLAGKAEDCEIFVKDCVPVHHRRLSDSKSLRSFAWINDVINDTPIERQLNAAAAPSHGAAAAAPAHGAAAGGNSTNATHQAAVGHTPSTLPAKCSAHPHFGNHDIHTAEKYLTWASIGILVIFLLEQFLLISDMGKHYLHPMFILDFAVISSSLAIELIVTNLAIGGLIVLARTWRFARIAHGVFIGKDEVEEINEEGHAFEALKEIWKKLPEERWQEIGRKHAELTPAEEQIAEELSKSTHAVMRAVALAKSYKVLSDDKKAKTARKEAEGKQNIV